MRHQRNSVFLSFNTKRDREIIPMGSRCDKKCSNNKLDYICDQKQEHVHVWQSKMKS